MEHGQILSVAVVTQAGGKLYSRGDILPQGKIHNIMCDALYFQGDPYDHYCGYDENGKLLFSINCLTPCVVEYA